MPKKGENIYKRKDGRWEARFIKGYHPNGKPKYGSCYGKTYREAKEKVGIAKTAFLDETKRPVPTKIKRRFSYICEEWLRVNRYKVKESTYVKYVNILENHIKPHLGGYLVEALSSSLIEGFGTTLLEEKKLSPKTVKDALTLLYSIMKYTKKHFPVPIDNIEIVYPKLPKSEMRVLTISEQTRFVDYLLKDMDECKFGVLLALLTGMRLGEICALRWENIIDEEQIIKVCSTMQRIKNLDGNIPNKTKIVISDPKSESSQRVIPLTNYTLALCAAMRPKNPHAFVLTGKADRYLEPRTMQYKMKQYVEDCKLSNVHFHTLRHTFATRCVEVGFEIKSLSEILGHSSPRITLERYVHSSMELKRDNMNKLEGLWS